VSLMASLYEGVKRRPLKERPTHNPSISPFEDTLKRLAEEAADEAMANLEAARSAFNESTGDQVDKAISQLASAEKGVRAIYEREGNLLTPEKVFLIRSVIRSQPRRRKIRPEFPLRA
jgi:hypothetical protein